MKLKILAILVLLAAGGVAVVASVGGLPAVNGAAATDYLTAAATTGDVTAEVAATGTVAATSTYALGFGAVPVLVGDTSAAAGSGTWRVTEVSAMVGKTVKEGDVLARASTADLEGQLTMARSSLSAARLQEKQAKTTLDDASGTAAIRQAKVAWYNAVNSRRQAEQSVSDLETQIGLATLVSPIDGTVTAVNIAKGLDSTGTAVTVASTTYQVTADVVESDVSSMTVGQAATVAVSAIDATIQGTVSAIAPAASTTTGSNSVVSYPVIVTLTGAPSALRAGMTADITIVTASATNVLTVPSAALRGTAGSYRVQVLGADGTPASRDVTVGLVTSSTAEIRSGLTAGEVVVTGTASTQRTTTATGGFGGGGVVVNGGGFGGGTRGGNFRP